MLSILFSGVGSYWASSESLDPNAPSCVETKGRTRVATYNLLNKNVPHARHFDAWPIRSSALAEFVNREQIDILATQEVVDEMLNSLTFKLSAFEKESLARSSDSEVGEHATIFFRRDRFERLSGGTAWLSESPQTPESKSWDASMPRIYTWLELKDRNSERKLWVLNVHYDHAGRKARIQSSKLLIDFIASLKLDRKDSVLLLGDFNANESSPEILILKANGFLDSREVSAISSEGIGGTFYDGRYIDHIFMKAALKVCSYRILDPRSATGKALSDHRPVVVDLVADH